MPNHVTKTFDLLGTPLRYFAKRGHRGRTGGFLQTPAAADRVVTNLNPRWDLYVTLNPSKPRSIKASVADVTSVRWFLLDFDPVPGNTGSFFIRPKWFDDLPFILLSSGRGYQAWVRIADHAPDLRWSVAAGHWIKTLVPPPGFTLDRAVTSAAQLARMPGTVNHKTGRTAEFVAECLDGELDPSFILKHWEEPPAAPGALPRELHAVLPMLPGGCADFLTQGVMYPHRDRFVYATARELAKGGIPLDTALEWIQSGNLLCRPRPIATDELNRQVRNAYRKVLHADSD